MFVKLFVYFCLCFHNISVFQCLLFGKIKANVGLCFKTNYISIIFIDKIFYIC